MNVAALNADRIAAVRQRARCLYDERAVEAALDQLAAAITAELADCNPLVLCVMNGAVIVTGKLATRLTFPLQMDYLHATRYRGETCGGELTWIARPTTPLGDRVVLVVDDILDEGVTLEKILRWCRDAGATAVYSAVLIEKQHSRKHTAVKADFVALQCEDHYLFGYGMDFHGYLRNAPGIYAVDPSDIRGASD